MRTQGNAPAAPGDAGGRRPLMYHRLEEEQGKQVSMSGGGLGPVGGWQKMEPGIILCIPIAF